MTNVTKMYHIVTVQRQQLVALSTGENSKAITGVRLLHTVDKRCFKWVHQTRHEIELRGVRLLHTVASLNGPLNQLENVCVWYKGKHVYFQLKYHIYLFLLLFVYVCIYWRIKHLIDKTPQKNVSRCCRMWAVNKIYILAMILMSCLLQFKIILPWSSI